MVQLHVETQCIVYSSIQGISILHEPPFHHFHFDYGIDRKNKNQTIKLKTKMKEFLIFNFIQYFNLYFKSN